MDGYVWRVPTVLGVMACSALVLFAAGVAGSVVRRRRDSTSCTLGTGAILVILAIAAAVAVRVTATLIASSLGISVMYIDPGAPGYVAPVLFAAFAFAVARRMLKETWTSRRAMLFYVWLLAFTTTNVVNRCSPGWCATIGFPFTWQAWSDSILTFGNDHVSRFMDASGYVISAVLNLLTFVVVARVLTRPGVLGRSA